jgi:hypothetical protein
MNRIDLFLKAKAGAERLQQQYPEDSSIESVIKQLSFLVELELGERSDAVRLNDIIIGVLALKEIDPLDPDLAELLYSVSSEVGTMKRVMLRPDR